MLTEMEAKTRHKTLAHVYCTCWCTGFSTCAGQKCYRQTDTLLDVELRTLENTLANKITQAPFQAVGERLTEVEAETLSDNTS